MSTKNTHNHIAEIASAFFVVSLCGTIWETSYLISIRPLRPDVAAGLIYPLMLKSFRSYISASDANCISLIFLCCWLSFGFAAYAIGPKRKTADVTSQRSGSHAIGIVFVLSVIGVAGGFVLLGRSAGDFLAAHGIVLQFYSHDLTAH